MRMLDPKHAGTPTSCVESESANNVRDWDPIGIWTAQAAQIAGGRVVTMEVLAYKVGYPE